MWEELIDTNGCINWFGPEPINPYRIFFNRGKKQNLILNSGLCNIFNSDGDLIFSAFNNKIIFWDEDLIFQVNRVRENAALLEFFALILGTKINHENFEI